MTMARFVELHTPAGDLVFITQDQVTHLTDKDDVTHVHFVADGSGPPFTAVHMPVRDVARLLSSD